MRNLNEVRNLRDLAKELNLTIDEFLDKAILINGSVSNDIQENLRTYKTPFDKGYKEYHIRSTTIEFTIQFVKMYDPEFYGE